MSSQCSSSTLQSESSPSQSETPHPALVLIDILEVLSYAGTPQELLQFRLVCQKWNDAVVHTLVTKRKNCFPSRLRYGPRVPRFLRQSEAERRAREVLENPIMTLTGSTIPLSFNTIVVDQDFYLAGINPEWQHFLGIYGESIRHLKFNIRSGEKPEDNSHRVTDCAQVVSRENLRAAFSAMPNLESLDFSVRFSDYGTHEPEPEGIPQGIFQEADQVAGLRVPQLKKLIKITIQEPHGIHYGRDFLIEILGIAPNLTTLYIKWSEDLSTIASALSALPNLDNSLTTLGITMTDCKALFDETVLHEFNFSRFHLTKLELNNICGSGEILKGFLQSQSSTLTTLILGDRSTSIVEPRLCYIPGYGHVIPPHRCMPLFSNPLCLPPIMDSLKILELNLPKYRVGMASLTSYPNRFPALEELSFSNCVTGCVWRWGQIRHLLHGEPSYTVKKFSLLGPSRYWDENAVIDAVRSTFPLAECHFV